MGQARRKRKFQWKQNKNAKILTEPVNLSTSKLAGKSSTSLKAKVHDTSIFDSYWLTNYTVFFSSTRERRSQGLAFWIRPRQSLNRSEPNLQGWFFTTLGPRSFNFIQNLPLIDYKYRCLRRSSPMGSLTSSFQFFVYPLTFLKMKMPTFLPIHLNG